MVTGEDGAFRFLVSGFLGYILASFGLFWVAQFMVS